jgi:hypothetical protein
MTVWVGSLAALSVCLLFSVQIASRQGIFASIFEQSQSRSMIRGSRILSIVDRIVTDDERLLKARMGDSKTKEDDENGTTSKSQTHDLSALTRKTMVDTSSTRSSSSSSSSLGSSNSSAPVKTSSGLSSSSAAVDHASTNTTKSSGNATKIGPSVKQTVAPTKPKLPDPGEHHSDFKKPLPPSYNYKDDDVDFPGLSLDSQLNPVVDDIAQFLDDELYPNATHGVLPPEREPPTNWPLDVFGIFLGAAVVLFSATAYKNYKKRKAYMAVSSN